MHGQQWCPLTLEIKSTKLRPKKQNTPVSPTSSGKGGRSSHPKCLLLYKYGLNYSISFKASRPLSPEDPLDPSPSASSHIPAEKPKPGKLLSHFGVASVSKQTSWRCSHCPGDGWLCIQHEAVQLFHKYCSFHGTEGISGSPKLFMFGSALPLQSLSQGDAGSTIKCPSHANKFHFSHIPSALHQIK